MNKYKIRCSDWLKFPLVIVNFNHFFIQPAPGHFPSRIRARVCMLFAGNFSSQGFATKIYHVLIFEGFAGCDMSSLRHLCSRDRFCPTCCCNTSILSFVRDVVTSLIYDLSGSQPCCHHAREQYTCDLALFTQITDDLLAART